MSITYDYDEYSQKTLKAWQDNLLKNNDNFKERFVISIMSIVAVQHEGGIPWTHGRIVDNK